MSTRAAFILGIVEAVILCSIVSGCSSLEHTAEQHYQEGLKHKEQREFRQAAQQFQLAIRQNPQHANAFMELGILFCRDRNYRQAIKHLLRAVEYDSSSYRPYAFIGYAYERLGRLNFSEQWYKRAITQASGLIDVRLRLADGLELQGKRQEAADMLGEVLEMKPDIENAEAISSRASLLRQPESPEVHHAMADVYIRHGQIQRGLSEYRKFEIFDPEDPGTLVNFGLFCLERDQFSTAAAYFQRAKYLGWTEQFEVRAGLGIAYEQLGKIEEAIQEYRATLDIQPDWYEIHLKLAELLEQLDRPIEAADELEQIFHLIQRVGYSNLRADFPDPNRIWSEILRLRGESLKKAVVQLKRSGQHNLVDVVVNQHVAATFWIEEEAKYTILSEKFAQTLGIQITPHTSEFHFEFAGESYVAPLVNLSSLRIGGLEARNIPVLIWNLSAYPEIEGLLGMSFLKHFRVEINYNDQLFVLTKLYS